MISRRPTAARALYKVLAAAEDLNINFNMVCANTTNGVGSPIDVNGNVLYFPLTERQVKRLQAGEKPESAVFCFSSSS